MNAKKAKALRQKARQVKPAPRPTLRRNMSKAEKRIKRKIKDAREARKAAEQTTETEQKKPFKRSRMMCKWHW